jgi:hypothetical protein
LEKRYQVFVSSTYEDLKDERAEVMQALLELNCIPAGMELFPAADEDQWSLIKKVIDDCDYYIVILGGRYGSLSPTGMSYTQMEYEYAVSTGKPVIGFVHRNPGSISSGKTESSETGREQLIRFREIVQQKACKFWETPNDLGGRVSRSMVSLIHSKPAIGWIRANKASQEEVLGEINELRKENERLRQEAERYQSDAKPRLENLAGLDETFRIELSYTEYGLDLQTLLLRSSVVQISWREMFALISPVIATHTPEVFVSCNFAQRVADHFNLEAESPHSVLEYHFETIRIQFEVLGLITRSFTADSYAERRYFWTLTPKGHKLMYEIKAIRSSVMSASEG